MNTLAPSFLNQSSSSLQVSRTCTWYIDMVVEMRKMHLVIFYLKFAYGPFSGV